MISRIDAWIYELLGSFLIVLVLTLLCWIPGEIPEIIICTGMEKINMLSSFRMNRMLYLSDISALHKGGLCVISLALCFQSWA